MRGSHSIRWELRRISFWGASIALVLACLSFMAFDYFTFRSNWAANVSTLGDLVGFNAASAVVFNDEASAARTLSALKGYPSMMAASIYLPDGRRFAGWRRDASVQDLPAPPKTTRKSHRFDRRSVVLFQPIFLEGAVVGTLVLQADLASLAHRFKRYAGISLVVFLFTVVVAILISNQVGREIVDPIGALTLAARKVLEQQDYSVRAPAGSQDEIGLLIRTFNEMLSKIQQDERSLRQAHDELEQRVQERTAQLTVANQELETFSYSVSHDLRSPLRAIDGFSLALQEDSQDRLNDEEKGHLKRIRAATQRMAELIDDLLKLARVTRSEMIRKEVDLSALVEKVANELKSANPDRSVEWRIAPGLEASGDPELLRVAFENLLGNAWKFTGKRPQATIEFGQTAARGKNAFFIRDNGAGFNMAYASKLFGAFQRLHDNKEYPGTGVGLATVQRIVHRHGGEIWADSEVDRGATFYFTLPN